MVLDLSRMYILLRIWGILCIIFISFLIYILMFCFLFNILISTFLKILAFSGIRKRFITKCSWLLLQIIERQRTPAEVSFRVWCIISVTVRYATEMVNWVINLIYPYYYQFGPCLRLFEQRMGNAFHQSNHWAVYWIASDKAGGL